MHRSDVACGAHDAYAIAQCHRAVNDSLWKRWMGEAIRLRKACMQCLNMADRIDQVSSIAKWYLELGDETNAELWAEKWTKVECEGTEPYYHLAQVYLHQNKRKEALAQFRVAQKKGGKQEGLSRSIAHLDSLFNYPVTIKLLHDVELTGRVMDFDTLQHSIQRCRSDHGWDFICTIDGRPFFGLDAGNDLPRNEFVFLYLTLDGQRVDLDVSGMFNPCWDGVIAQGMFDWHFIEKGYLLRGYFSDGAGSYIAEWTITVGSSMRTQIERFSP